MRWELARTDGKTEQYHLLKDDKKILTLSINSFSHTAKVECENEKRIFQVRSEGFLRNKVVLRNEYGVKIGELGQENGESFIDINDERFFYVISTDPEASLSLYRDSKSKPLVTCRLNTHEGNTSIDRRSLSSSSTSELLMALCWYMFLPVAQPTSTVYSS